MTSTTPERSSGYKGVAVAFAGALLGALVLGIMALWAGPTEAQRCPPGEPDCQPPNSPPTVAADKTSVMAAEGQTATNTGTYSDSAISGGVAITASVGEVSKTGTNRGTWSWSLANAPLGRQQVTITATDSFGESSTTVFTLTVTLPNENGPIAFASDRVTATNPEGDYEIYTMNPDGADVRQLTQNAAADYEPAYSTCAGTNNFIAFVSERDGNAEIYKMTPSGNNQTRLTNNSTYDSSPSWSSDCAKIAFFRIQQDGGYIYKMDASGANQTNLTNGLVSDSNPSWAPDGTKIAFARIGGSTRGIYKMDASGANQTRLTNNASDDNPSWSPDGTKIAFERVPDSSEINYEIYTMDASGANQTRLTNNPPIGGHGGYDGYPSWSPDGTKIAFYSTPGAGYYDVYVMDANGANRTNLTNTQFPTADKQPSWGKVDIGYVP